MDRSGRWCRWALGLCICLAGAAAAEEAEAPFAKSGGKGIRGAGFTYAKEVYPRLMKNPASTEFDWESVAAQHTFNVRDARTEKMVSVYKVSGILRSRNSFNALVPSEWSMYVVERDDSSEMAIAMLDGKIVAQTEMGTRLLEFADKVAERRREKAMQEAAAQAAAAERKAACDKARGEGETLGRAHAAKLKASAKKLSPADIGKRAAKFAADKGLTDEAVVAEFSAGYRAGLLGEDEPAGR